MQSNNTKSELRVDSVSLKEFTKYEWQENRFKNIEKVVPKFNLFQTKISFFFFSPLNLLFLSYIF